MKSSLSALLLLSLSLLLLLSFALDATEALSKRDPTKPTPTPPPPRIGRVKLNPELSEYENQGRVVSSLEELKKVIDNVPRVLLYLHAEWSFPSVESLEDSLTLAKELCASCKPEDELPKLQDDEVLLVRVNCRATQSTCVEYLNHTTFSPYDLYPSFMLFWNDPTDNNNRKIDHYPQLNTHPLHVESLKKWLKGRLSIPFVHRLTSAEEYKQFIAPTDDVLESQAVIAFIGNDASKVQSFKDAANNVRFEGWRFAYIDDDKLIEEIGQDKKNQIRVFFNGTSISDNFISLADSAVAPTSGDLKTFVCQYGYPSVVPFSIRTHRRFVGCAPIPYLIFLLSKDPWVHDQAAEIEMLHSVTPKYLGKIQFAYQHTPHVWQDFATFVGASGFIFPGAMIFKQQSPIIWDDKKVLWDESVELTDESFTQWLDDFLAGKAVSWRRSLPLPKRNDGPIKTVVGFNFEDVVYDETKDVLLAYVLSTKKCLASWRMNIILKELGEAFAKTSVVVAQTNGEHNAFPDGSPEVDGFPTLYLFPANNKQSPIEFEEEETSARAIGKFIKQHATTKFSVDVDKLSDTLLEDIKEEMGQAHDSESHGKQFTREDIKNINREPQKEPIIPKDHPMYHYSQHVHHHDHDEDGGHHHHHHPHPHSHNEEEEEFVVLGENTPQQTVFTTTAADRQHDHQHDHGHDHKHEEHFQRHSHYHNEIIGEHPDHERTQENQHEHEHDHHHQHAHVHKEKHEHEHQHGDDTHVHKHKHAVKHAHEHDHHHKHGHEHTDPQQQAHEHQHADDKVHSDHQHAEILSSHDHDHHDHHDDKEDDDDD
eukprot:TRINITY_DN3547_c0_g1_i2.p1 TRINITY_DN3547_c0_g1~~TRINITY_DN3547_c0_g1_i2.p1  ORF type:complete len:820 (-),score=208.22 TRINITY_DN3547_c0_g1_i2:68-2527(-)